MKVINRSSVLVVLVGFALFLTPDARANYEYQCGGHRTAKCHEEPRSDDSFGCYGRCGPGCNWTILGNAYTNACANHDSCVRSYLSGGSSQWTAHTNCAGSLPGAVGSFVQTHWNYGFQWAKETASGVWKKIKACCN